MSRLVLSAPSRRIDQSTKQALLAPTENHELRMPLDAQQERMVVAFDGLNDSIFVAGNDAELRAEPINRLVVQRVDPLSVATKQSMQLASGDDLDGLLGQGRAYAGNARVNVIDALMQGSPKEDIGHLSAAANAEDRQVVFGRRLQKLQLEGVASAIDADVGFELPP